MNAVSSVFKNKIYRCGNRCKCYYKILVLHTRLPLDDDDERDIQREIRREVFLQQWCPKSSMTRKPMPSK